MNRSDIRPKWMRFRDINARSIWTGPLAAYWDIFILKVFRFVAPQSLTARVQIWCLFHIKWAKPSNGCNLGLVSQVTYNLAQKMSYIPNICHLNIVNLGQCLKVPLSFAGCCEKRKEKCSQNGCVWGITVTAAFKMDHLLPIEPFSYQKFSTSKTLKA